MGEATTKSARRTGGSAAQAEAVVAEASQAVLERYLSAMAGEGSGADRAARVLEQVALQDAALLAPHVCTLLSLLYGGRDRVSQAAGICLSELTRTAPAKVGKHLHTLRRHASGASQQATAGTFLVLVGLCRASVSYQRRVQDMLEEALREAEPKMLEAWAALALPVLKGEPYAEVRALVESRLVHLPEATALRIAQQLGVPLSGHDKRTACR